MDSLSRIALFLHVARLQSFAGAARHVGLTPSAVSKQVQNLEAELRVKLLNRTTRSVSLTEEGALYYERASRALSDLEEAAERLNELKTTPRGQLKVSIPTVIGTRFLKGPIAQFARRYPEVTLDVQFEDRLINVHEEGFDLVLRIAVMEDSSLVARTLIASPIKAFCSPDYLATHGNPESPGDLARHNVLAYTRNKGAHEWRWENRSSGEEGVVSLQSNFRCDFAEMMIAAAVEGIGIIICPDLFVQREVREGQLVPLLESCESTPPRNLYAVFPSNRFMSSRMRLFIDHVADYFKGSFQQLGSK